MSSLIVAAEIVRDDVAVFHVIAEDDGHEERHDEVLGDIEPPRLVHLLWCELDVVEPDVEISGGEQLNFNQDTRVGFARACANSSSMSVGAVRCSTTTCGRDSDDWVVKAPTTKSTNLFQ